MKNLARLMSLAVIFAIGCGEAAPPPKEKVDLPKKVEGGGDGKGSGPKTPPIPNVPPPPGK